MFVNALRDLEGEQFSTGVIGLICTVLRCLINQVYDDA